MNTSYLIRLESMIGVPCRQDRFLNQGGFEYARRGVLQWFAGLGVCSCGMFREYDLGTISSPKISYVSTDPKFPCFLRNMYPNFGTCGLKKQKRKEGNYTMD